MTEFQALADELLHDEPPPIDTRDVDPIDQPQPVIQHAQPTQSVLAFVDRLHHAGVTEDQPVVSTPAARPVEAPPVEDPHLREAAPQPLPQATVAIDTGAADLDLTTFLPVQLQASALAARCPMHQMVQFAIDRSGRLHLMLQDVDPAEALTVLSQTRMWASLHAKLLQLTCPDTPVDITADPMLHIFTDQAKAVVALAAHAERTCCLHLLQPITIAGHTQWVATALN